MVKVKAEPLPSDRVTRQRGLSKARLLPTPLPCPRQSVPALEPAPPPLPPVVEASALLLQECWSPPLLVGISPEFPVAIASENAAERKPLLDPLSALQAPQPRPYPTQVSALYLRKSEDLIAHVKASLAFELQSTTHDVDTMIELANRAFMTLDCAGDDNYEQFHRMVRSFIQFHRDLVAISDAKQRTGSCNAIMMDQCRNLVVESETAEREVMRAEAGLLEGKGSVVSLRKKVAEMRDLLIKLEREMDEGESRVVVLECERDRACEARDNVEAEVQRLGFQVETAGRMGNEIEQRRKEAIYGITQIKTQLGSFC